MTPPKLKSQMPAHRSLSVARFGAETTACGENTVCDPTQPPAPTVHPHASLAYYLSGTATIWAGSTYRVGPGDVLIIPEGMPHYSTSDDAVEALGMAMCTACVASAAGGHLAAMLWEVADGASALRTVAPASRPKLRNLLVSLEDELAAPGALSELAVEGYLSLLATILRRAAPGLTETDQPPAGPSLSQRALAFISRSATDGISLAEVAEHVHRSPAHTAAVVGEQTGRTVVEWITQSRMAVARQLLLRTDDTVAAIAWRIGYESPSHFHRIFKRHHGNTPGAWRRRHRKPKPPH